MDNDRACVRGIGGVCKLKRSEVGNFIDGIISGLEVLADAAGQSFLVSVDVSPRSVT